MTLQIPTDEFFLVTDRLISFTDELVLLGSFTSPFVVIQVTSQNADPSWSQAGSVAQGVEIIDQLAYGNIKELRLNQLNLLQFPLITPDSYQLYYLPLLRLQTVRIRIWAFMGQTIDTSVVNLIAELSSSAVLQVDLSGIQEQIDCLKSMMTQIINAIGVEQPEPPPIPLTELEKTFYILN